MACHAREQRSATVMRAIRHVRAWCQPGQPGPMGLGLLVSLLLLGSHAPVIAQNALLGKTQSAIGTLVVIRPDNIENRLQGQGALQLYEGDVLRTEAASQAVIKVQDDGQTTLTVIQGTVEFGTAFGTCPIRTSTISYGVRGKRCTKPEPVDVQPTRAWLQGLGK